MANEAKKMAGVIGLFTDGHNLVEAAGKAHQAGYSLDAYTPFPVHGLDHAMGLKRSPIPYITFGAGLTGSICAFGLQYWTSAIDWPLNVSGKPFNSWPAFVPVMFELTVLFAGLATFGALLFFCGFPNIKKRIFDTSITKDRFALVIEAKGGQRTFSEQDAGEFLRKVGAQDVRPVYEEGWFS